MHLIFLCIPAQASPHIVQAAHARAKTKAYPKSVAAPVR